MLPRRKQEGHHGISLFPVLPLGIRGPHPRRPPVHLLKADRTTVVCAPSHLTEALQHGTSRDQVVRADAGNGSDGGQWIKGSVLLHRCAELFRICSCQQSTHHLICHPPPSGFDKVVILPNLSNSTTASGTCARAKRPDNRKNKCNDLSSSSNGRKCSVISTFERLPCR